MKMTVAQLKKHLENFYDDGELYIGCDEGNLVLASYRPDEIEKRRASRLPVIMPSDIIATLPTLTD